MGGTDKRDGDQTCFDRFFWSESNEIGKTRPSTGEDFFIRDTRFSKRTNGKPDKTKFKLVQCMRLFMILIMMSLIGANFYVHVRLTIF